MTALTPTPATMRLVLDAIDHARAKHGDRTIDHLPLHHRVSVLAEEVGEVARCVQAIDTFTERNMPKLVESSREDLRAELAQVAACALLWLEQELGE